MSQRKFVLSSILDNDFEGDWIINDIEHGSIQTCCIERKMEKTSIDEKIEDDYRKHLPEFKDAYGIEIIILVVFYHILYLITFSIIESFHVLLVNN